MVSVILSSVDCVSRGIASRAKAQRLHLNLSQKTLSERSGVSYGTLKKFERTGKISLESLLKLAFVLGEVERFEQLFGSADKMPASLDDLFQEETRKRGRK